MKQIRNWKVKQWATAAGALVFVICLLWVLIGLALSKPDLSLPQNAAPSKSAEDQTAPDTETKTDVTDEGGGFPQPELDNTGFAPMLVTDDPRQAAAAAAMVLWSGQFGPGKIEFAEDFRAEALLRIGNPSPEYGGPGDIKTTVPPGDWSNRLVPPDPIAGDPVKAMLDAQFMPVRPDGWWFMLGDEPSVSALVARHATVTSKTITVFDAEQVTELDPSVDSAIEENWVPIREGVTAHKFWVRVETSIDMGGEVAKSRNAAAFMVYCDPPSEGGTCGVGLLTRSYPKQWQHQ